MESPITRNDTPLFDEPLRKSLDKRISEDDIVDIVDGKSRKIPKRLDKISDTIPNLRSAYLIITVITIIFIGIILTVGDSFFRNIFHENKSSELWYYPLIVLTIVGIFLLGIAGYKERIRYMGDTRMENIITLLFVLNVILLLFWALFFSRGNFTYSIIICLMIVALLVVWMVRSKKFSTYLSIYGVIILILAVTTFILSEEFPTAS